MVGFYLDNNRQDSVESDETSNMSPSLTSSCSTDYNVENTLTSQLRIGHVVINVGKQPAKPSKTYKINLPDGGHLFAVLYATILVLLGAAFPIKEALQEKWVTTYVEAIYLAYIYGAAFSFILFMELYQLRKSREMGQKAKDIKEKAQIVVKDHTSEATYAAAGKSDDAMSMDSGSTTGSKAEKVEVFVLQPEDPWHPPHSTSLYVRFGAIIFGLGNMVYDGLLIKQIQDNSNACLKPRFVWPHYIHLCFLLVQTYFIFKHAELKITFAKPIARLGFLHLVATNTCVWIRTLVRETLDGFLYHTHDSHHLPDQPHVDAPADTGSGDGGGGHVTVARDTYHGDHHRGAGDEHGTTLNESVTDSLASWLHTAAVNASDEPTVVACDHTEDILLQASPYLFPCVLEYSLLAAAVMYIMYARVGAESPTPPEENKPKTLQLKEMISEINFHKSNKGLFSGLTILAATLVALVLFIAYMGMEEEVGSYIYLGTLIGLYCLVMIATIGCYIRMRSLEFFELGGISVEDVLLIVAMAGTVILNVLKLMPIIDYLPTHYDTITMLALGMTVLAIVVPIFQTIFLVDGLHRFTVTENQLWSKPGRQGITFLMLSNLALWLFLTFNMTVSFDGEKAQEEIYGYLAWTLMEHTFVPLMIFYHFHSSACLARIWSDAYRTDTLRDCDLDAKEPAKDDDPSDVEKSIGSIIVLKSYNADSQPAKEESEDTAYTSNCVRSGEHETSGEDRDRNALNLFRQKAAGSSGPGPPNKWGKLRNVVKAASAVRSMSVTSDEINFQAQRKRRASYYAYNEECKEQIVSHVLNAGRRNSKQDINPSSSKWGNLRSVMKSRSNGDINKPRTNSLPRPHHPPLERIVEADSETQSAGAAYDEERRGTDGGDQTDNDMNKPDNRGAAVADNHTINALLNVWKTPGNMREQETISSPVQGLLNDAFEKDTEDTSYESNQNNNNTSSEEACSQNSNENSAAESCDGNGQSAE